MGRLPRIKTPAEAATGLTVGLRCAECNRLMLGSRFTYCGIYVHAHCIKQSLKSDPSWKPNISKHLTLCEAVKRDKVSTIPRNNYNCVSGKAHDL